MAPLASPVPPALGGAVAAAATASAEETGGMQIVAYKVGS